MILKKKKKDTRSSSAFKMVLVYEADLGLAFTGPLVLLFLNVSLCL